VRFLSARSSEDLNTPLGKLYVRTRTWRPERGSRSSYLAQIKAFWDSPIAQLSRGHPCRGL